MHDTDDEGPPRPFFLVLTVGCTALLSTPGVIPPLAIGSVLMVMVYAGGHVSGGHYNPAVTLGVWMRGRCATGDVAPYMLAQIGGAVLAALAARCMVDQTHFALMHPRVFPALGERRLRAELEAHAPVVPIACLPKAHIANLAVGIPAPYCPAQVREALRRSGFVLRRTDDMRHTLGSGKRQDRGIFRVNGQEMVSLSPEKRSSLTLRRSLLPCPMHWSC